MSEDSSETNGDKSETNTSDDTKQDEGMVSVEIQDEELAREYEKERKQARYITYGLLLLFACVCIYILYRMLTEGSVFELDLVNRFIDLLSSMS